MTRGGRILVVEDDAGVAAVVSAALGEEGFECLWVASDTDAQDAIMASPPPLALVLDINLGLGTTGFDVARFGRQRHPDIPVIFMSGSVSERSFKAFGVPHSHFLTKPFSLEELQMVLRDAIPSIAA